MLDILLSRLREEIAIDGYSDIANDLGAKITPLVDDKYKSFIWDYLKLEKELEFYENVLDMGQNNINDTEPMQVETQRKQPPKAKKKTPPKKKTKPKKKAKSKKRSSARSSAVNSDDDFDASVNSDESSSEESDFEQDESDEDMKEQYGSRLYITGTYEFQQIQLYTGVPPGANLSPNLVIILQEILRSRSRGLLQADITKIIGIDSRSTGHYCKSLEEKGCIVRNGVSTLKMRTNVCIHARFTAKQQSLDIADQEVESVPYNVNIKGETFSQARLRDDLTDLIMESPDNAILSEDVLRALAFDITRKSVRKWFNRTVDELCIKGYLKKSNFRENNKGRAHRCLHLVNLPEKKKAFEEFPLDEINFPIRIHSIRNDVPIIPTLVDCSLESQVLQVLRAAADYGATQKEIGFALNTDEGRILYKIMEKLCELTDIGLQRYGAGRLLEFEGRQRRYRYYTYRIYKRLHEGIDMEIPPLPEQEMDESKLYEADFSADTVHTIKSFKNLPTKRSSETETNEPSKKARHDADIIIDADEGTVTEQSQSSSTPVEQVSVAPPTIPTSVPIDVPNKEASTKKPARMFDIFSNTRRAAANKGKAPATPKPVEITQPTRDPVSVEKETTLTENVAAETSIALNETTASIDMNATLNNTPAITNETASSATSSTNITLVVPMEVDNPGSSTAYSAPIALVSVESPSISTPSKDTPEPIVLRGPRKSPLVFKSGSTHKISGTTKQVNVYMETRLKVLYALLQDQPMWELSQDLKAAYTEKAETMFGPIKYAVCNKTLWRSARILAERGKAKTDTLICPLWNGDTVERKILVRNDVDMNGKEYITFKKRAIERRTMQVNRTPNMSLENTPASIERLEERIARLKEELRVLQESDQVVEAKILQERIDDLSNNAQMFRPVVHSKPEAWLIARIQFGWIHARMLRIKAMYMYVYKLMTSDEDINGVDKLNRTIDTSAIVNNMTLSLMCQVVGILRPAGFIVEFTRNPDNMNLRYHELPSHVKAEVFSDKNAFRRRLRSLMASLEYLDFVKPNIWDYKKVDSQVYSSLAANYILCDKVPIKDRKRIGQPVIREHKMESASEVSNFWGELQYNCTHGQVPIPEEELEPPPDNSWVEELWRGMYHTPNWSNTSVFTRLQRKILNSYVDKVKSTTPVENTTVCLDISKETNLSVQTVRRYYEKVEVALSRKNQDRKMKEYRKKFYPTRASRKKPNPIGGRRVINLSSTRAFKQTNRKSAGTYVQSQGSLSLEDNEKIRNDSKSKGFEINLDDLNKAPVISGPANLVTVRQGRIKRSSWNSHEDDLIIYGYAIARQRANGFAVRWFPINALFPSKPSSAARHRLGRLVADPRYAEQLENATNQWARFYLEGMESGEIRDPDPTEVTNYDLLSYLAYFIKRLSEDEPVLHTPLLPSSVEVLNEHFDIGRNLLESNPYVMDDLYFSKTTLVSQMSILYSHALFARRANNEAFDNSEIAWEKENDIRERQRRILTNFSMMCLFTPTEVFDPFYSYSVIGLYPQEVFFEALKILRDHGSLILAKQERAIPGTKYTISAKFNGIMAGHLPENVFIQANRFDKFLNEEGCKIRFSPEYADSGTMVCLFDLMSEQKVKIKFHLIENIKLKKNVFREKKYLIVCVDRGLGYFEIDIEKAEKEPPYITQGNFEEKKLQDMDQLHFNISVENFLRNQEEQSKELLRRIIDLLEAEKDNGLTIYQLKLKLKLKDNYDDKAILLAVSLLESSDPALIFSVGFNAARYVTAAHTSTWLIRTIDATLHSSKVKLEPKDVLYPRCKSKNVVRKEFISPNLWTDINGNVTHLILNECKTSIVDFLLIKPGSSDASIYRKYQAAFDRKHLHDVLDLLVKQNVVRRVQVHQLSNFKARTSIFGKTRTLKCANETVIANASQSFYWVQPHYYRSIV
ncbi:hypothetical protein EDC94DRAFT_516058 [Helicostylum pulchrum]|nr:hypothetical protein EDC94DRAFT_516058 [Helicostylum pulchrum]